MGCRAIYLSGDGPEAAAPGAWDRLWHRAAEVAGSEGSVVVLLDEIQHLADWSARPKGEWDRILRLGLAIQLPGPVAVRIGESRLPGRLLHAQVYDLAEAALEAAADLPQRMGLGQLAEQHADELIPAAEALGAVLGAVPADRALEIRAGEQLQKLAKQAGNAYHRSALRRGPGKLW